MMRNRLIMTFLCVMFLVIVSGCTSNIPLINPSGNNTPSGPQANSAWGNFSVTYNVVDSSGNSINYSYRPVYSRSGHFTRSNYKTGESGSGGGITYNTGTTYSLETMWPVNPGDYIVFGACNNYSWLSDDLANFQFNPGKAGYWPMITYDDIMNHTKGDRNGTINVTVAVSAETGKMLKLSR